METLLRLLAELIVLALILLILPPLWEQRKHKKRKKRVKGLAKGTVPFSPQEFLAGRKSGMKDALKFAGVYIIRNMTRNSYYVGQAVDVDRRLYQHFTGHGNGDVYADYKIRKDKFEIRVIRLSSSGFKNLNDLERYAIGAYSAYDRGYNRTRGNK